MGAFVSAETDVTGGLTTELVPQARVPRRTVINMTQIAWVGRFTTHPP